MRLMPSLRFALLAAMLLVASLAGAQTTYQWIDPKTGSTVISDQQPPPGAKQVLKRESDNGGSNQQMPYATRQAAEKFPVTLYTSENCAEGCKLARSLLSGRGVPFSEK